MVKSRTKNHKLPIAFFGILYHSHLKKYSNETHISMFHRKS